MIPILVLSGKKRVGKTTTVSYIQSIFPNLIELTFAEPLKQVSQILFDLSDEQLYDPDKKEEIDSRWLITPRTIFQQIGDVIRYDIPSRLYYYHPPGCNHYKLCTLLLLNKINKIRKNHEVKQLKVNQLVLLPSLVRKTCSWLKDVSLIIVSDMRLPDEYEALRSLENVFIVRITKESQTIDPHHTENNFLPYDQQITNNGTFADLHQQIDNILLSNLVMS
jgi:hypothetical protein